MRIRDLIKVNGSINVADFMREAMFNNIHGYYQNQKPIGKDRDFITAPEISSLFGELISSYIFSIIHCSKLDEVNIVEMGAGIGTMFRDIVNQINKINKYFNSNITFNFSIIEISDKLSLVQRQYLNDLNCNISWYKTLDEFIKNNSKPSYFISNEMFDCFAINQFIKTENLWQELIIKEENEKLYFAKENYINSKHKIISVLAKENGIGDEEDNIIFEHSFDAINFMKKLCDFIYKNKGMALIIDYGYYESPRKSTFQALKNHKFSNPLENISESDLTALVNFKSLEICAQKANLKSSFMNQREFLISLGINERLKKLESNNNFENIKNSIKRLVDNDQMGDLFKTLIVWKD